MTTAREELKARLNDLVSGHYVPSPIEGADDDYVQGVVDFWDDSVDLDRLADGVMALSIQITLARAEAGS